eukprot:GHVN01069058.1.p1 GENE.GHVN01069058.1~~GHVN01069058.1.p1  ORF type:complete len:555 (+),score=81.03 GHVN01069058.1:192-1667(+)
MVVRHSLIPNLLDSARKPRYNARDATWWWLQSIQDYCLLAPEGTDFLTTSLALHYPLTDSQAQSEVTLSDLMHHVMSSHMQGIAFREWRAGPQLDEHMTDMGFNVSVGVNLQMGGIPVGGNAFNCGTWMDKMGSSEKAGNNGVPATPRDGAPVEIVGLLCSTLRFINDLINNDDLMIWPHKTVHHQGQEVAYKRWRLLLQARFERLFYVPPEQGGRLDTQTACFGASTRETAGTSPHDDQDRDVAGVSSSVGLSECGVDKGLGRRSIYKDTVCGTDPCASYQLRPNLFVAMAVAPELMHQEHALSVLRVGESCLSGPSQLGLKTLDPDDPHYRPNYDNTDDGYDKTTAHGWNYHQGPEWVWPLGYYLQAKFQFLCPSLHKGSHTPRAVPVSTTSVDGCDPSGPQRSLPSLDVGLARRLCFQHLIPHRRHLERDRWMSLPELTNQDGRLCSHGCPAQAWSVATVLAFFQHVCTADQTHIATPTTQSPSSPSE